MGLAEYFRNAIYMNLIYEDRYQLILSGLWVTLVLTVCTFVLGTLWVWPSAPARGVGAGPSGAFATASPL